MTYTAARLEAFNAMLASGMYGGEEITVNGSASYDVIATTVEIQRGQTLSGYQPDRDVDIEIKKTDWTASGLAAKSNFSMGGKNYVVTKYKIADREPTVKFSAVLKK